jgi:hypothetical protein
MAGLDWRHHTIGPLRPCRLCHRPALMRDEHGQPCHKTCAEQTLTTPPVTDRDALVIDLDTYRTTAGTPRDPDATRPRHRTA